MEFGHINITYQNTSYHHQYHYYHRLLSNHVLCQKQGVLQIFFKYLLYMEYCTYSMPGIITGIENILVNKWKNAVYAHEADIVVEGQRH